AVGLKSQKAQGNAGRADQIHAGPIQAAVYNGVEKPPGLALGETALLCKGRAGKSNTLNNSSLLSLLRCRHKSSAPYWVVCVNIRSNSFLMCSLCSSCCSSRMRRE